jgi:hypothetical protein
MVDYDIGREEFINMGEMMLRFIYDVNISINLLFCIVEHKMVRVSLFLHWSE